MTADEKPADGAEHALPSLWLLRTGPEDDVVVSSRMRLARNVDGYHFRTRFREGEDRRLEEALRRALGEADPGLQYLSLPELPESRREMLFERHLVSAEHAHAEHARGVAFNGDGTVSVMVNEEDHLRLQVFAPGMDLDSLAEQVTQLDQAIGRNVTYSFNPTHGYLTSCPTNTGTGLRVSVMLHLPALAFKSEDGSPVEQGIMKVHNAAQQLGLAVRGMHGESSRAEGDFFQISNQVTLGRTPSQAVEDLQSALPQVIDFERNMRDILWKDDRSRVEDLVWRAWAILTHARRISSSEGLAHLSSLRLGACLGIIEDVPVTAIHELMVVMRPGHLQHRVGRELSPAERDVVRAELIRDTLGA